MYPVLQRFGGFQYALGLGNDTLGTQGTLPNNGTDVAAAFRDMDGDSRADYAVIDWDNSRLASQFRPVVTRTALPPTRQISPRRSAESKMAQP
jgi:hypothetical protein